MTRRETITGDMLATQALALAADRAIWLLGDQGADTPDLAAGLDALSQLGAIPLARLFERFRLSPLEQDIWLIVAAQELGSQSAAALADHPLSLKGRATPALVAHVLGGEGLRALGAQRLLMQAALVEAGPGPGLAQRTLSVDAALVHFIHGHPQISDALRDILQPLGAGQGDGARLAQAVREARQLPGFPLVHISGQDGLAAERLAASAFASLGLRAFALDEADALPPARLAALINRDLVLLEGGLVLNASEAADRLADGITVPLITWGSRAPRTRRASAELPLPTPEGEGMRLGLAAKRDAQATFDLGFAPSVWASEHARAARALEGLAEPIQPQAIWDDLVLPEAQLRQLRQLAAFQTHRAQVLDTWGFRAKSSRGLGLAALFSGPSGTGKTMAAEIVAAELAPPNEALGLYRVDLSAIVSKYIGETEKNLARIFDAAEHAGVVLVFDEGEALFGKRTTDVKDSLDRHANTETAFLLQRLEAYSGCAIVTTNLKATVDEAFLRRFRVVVDFPFPDTQLREQIWRVVFPEATPLDDLDYSALGKLAVSGGFIRSIALSAAFIAAADGGAVTMARIGRAARQEFGKIGKPLPEAQMRAFR